MAFLLFVFGAFSKKTGTKQTPRAAAQQPSTICKFHSTLRPKKARGCWAFGLLPMTIIKAGSRQSKSAICLRFLINIF